MKMSDKLKSKSYLAAAALVAFLLLAVSVPAKDTPPIRIRVDLREAPRHIFHAQLEIPAVPGPLTLFYPQWIPGEHGPTGPIADLTGLKLTSAGKPLVWRRDAVNMYAFHCEVPAGADSVEVSLDYLSPGNAEGFSGSPAATAQLAVLEWNLVLLYPQGRPSDELTYVATLRLPAGWKFGTALEVARESADGVEFRAVTLTTLVDSPVIAGAYFRGVPLSHGQTPEHRLDLAGDSAAAVTISPQQVASYAQLVAEAGALFGARHYGHYDFLLALSDHVNSFGLEHHQSSDNRAPERMLLDPNLQVIFADLLPHEFVHSWNGKYRRPRGLLSPDYQQPMRGELLWVYEGLTEYLGEVLAARSGLLTPELYREILAWVAAYLDQRPGRTWRPLEDTAVAAQVLYNARDEWASWRRSVDFYDESNLIWLEADAIIRRESQGRRSLDDFCRRFHGASAGGDAAAAASSAFRSPVVPYTFDDVVAAMNEIAPYDWRNFFLARLDSTAPHAPLGGLEGSGWRLVFSETPNERLHAAEEARNFVNVQFSLGVIVKRDNSDKDGGRILDVIPGSPAAQAGVAPGLTLVAVNGRHWSPDVLRAAVRDAKGGSEPIELLLENAGYYKTYRVDYHGGERYPHLERDASRPDLLGQIIHPRASPAATAGKEKRSD